MGAVYKVYHAIFGQFDPLPLPHFVTHPGTPQKYVTHLGPPFLVGLVQKPGQKPPVQILSIVRGGFYPGRFVRGSFAWKVLYCTGGFCPIPLLSEYICYSRKVNITFNFMFHMYDKKMYKLDITWSWPPLPHHVLYGRPHSSTQLVNLGHASKRTGVDLSKILGETKILGWGKRFQLLMKS